MVVSAVRLALALLLIGSRLLPALLLLVRRLLRRRLRSSRRLRLRALLVLLQRRLLRGGAELRLLRLLLLDVVQRHAHDRLLHLGGAARALLPRLLGLALLVLPAPVQRPLELHGLNLLLRERVHLVADEEL